MADQDLARLQPADLLGGGGRDAEDDVGAPGDVGVADLGPGLLVLGVGMAGRLAGAGLDDDVDVLVRFSDLTTSGTSATRRSPSAVSFGTPIFIAARKLMRSSGRR